ncbi:probable ATP-dependent RNA helicase CG8611 [Leguminivora glycinivorella]|uniref:probable ATP-dependent RNA helicase CG8611 n=1 Tax=Leguminivora glycinivorella TaxID=1035111 RepID=UPI00200BD9BE|nr:probable ATP-dependent RNA helicase CG8611 [Leguminivora glycinivorella]
MDDLQLNISVAKKATKKTGGAQKNASEYKFMSKPAFTGKTIARKRAITNKKTDSEHPIKVPRQSEPQAQKSVDLSSSLRDLSENKGKFQGKSYQDLSDDIQLKQKPRAGGWISSLFKNNPDVPRIGQRAVKPVVEKVFAEKSFSDLDIHPHSVANLQQNLGLKELMVVQQSAVPVILQGRDALIRSQTGSGKTLAYALPIIEGLQAIRPKINRHDGIRAVVVVPTRELAVQTHELFLKLVKPFTWIVPGLLSGGQKRKAEKARLRKGLNILIGTPGRINDHLRHTQSLNFAKTGCLVLDEADRLLDMGYEKDVAAIVKAIEDHKKAATYDPLAMVKSQIKSTFPDAEEEPTDKNEDEGKTEIKHHLTEVFLSKDRQTTLLSATLTKAVENLAGITMVDPVFVDAADGKALVADSLKPHKDNTKQAQSSAKDIQTLSEKTVAKPNVTEEDTEQNDEEEEGPEEKQGLKLFRQDKSKSLFSMDDLSDSEATPVPFPGVPAVEKQKKTKEKPAPIPGVVDMESDDEYVMPEPDIAPSFEAAVKTAIKEDELVMPVSVKQSFLIVPMKLRLVTLCSLIVEHCVMNKRGGKLMVFMATLEMVDYHAELIETVLTGKPAKSKLNENPKSKKRKANEDKESDSDSEFEVDYQAPPEGGVVPVELSVFRLHGSMPHESRIEVFDQFRKAKKGVLFCTDVAARGLDVPRVDLVLQYCAPASATDYVHRVGRTGRASNVGEAVMFLLPSETEFMRHLEQKRIRLTQRNEKHCLEPLLTIVPGAANANRAAIAVQARLEQTAHTDKSWLLRASRAYTTWVRFYSGYPRDVREFLDAKQLHLGHAAKAFALRDTPAALAKRAKYDPDLKRERPVNKLTVHDEEERKRPGFPKVKAGLSGRIVNKQSSMHTASEFDSGLPPLEQARKKQKKNK